jgi:hypothetical protein
LRSSECRTRTFLIVSLECANGSIAIAENALVISVEFANEWQAQAFAVRFDGKVPTATHYLS